MKVGITTIIDKDDNRGCGEEKKQAKSHIGRDPKFDFTIRILSILHVSIEQTMKLCGFTFQRVKNPLFIHTTFKVKTRSFGWSWTLSSGFSCDFWGNKHRHHKLTLCFQIDQWIWRSIGTCLRMTKPPWIQASGLKV